MKPTHFTQISFINPVIEHLVRKGETIEPLLSVSGLDRFQLGNSEGFIPVRNVHLFFDAINRKNGTSDFAANFSNQYHMGKMGEVGRQVMACSDLLTACLGAVKYDQCYQSNQRLWLEFNGHTAKYNNVYIDPPSNGRHIFEIFSIANMISGFRHFLGNTWHPLELHLTGDSIEGLNDHFNFNETKVMFNQPSFGLIASTSDLTFDPFIESKNIQFNNLPETDTSLTHRIKLLLSSVTTQPLPGLEFFSDIFNTSSRTLQRRLAQEDTSIFQIIDQWRFKKSIQLLNRSGLNLKEISQRLGYQNDSNFHRAFFRWTNTTPQRYRNRE